MLFTEQLRQALNQAKFDHERDSTE